MRIESAPEIEIGTGTGTKGTETLETGIGTERGIEIGTAIGIGMGIGNVVGIETGTGIGIVAGMGIDIEEEIGGIEMGTGTEMIGETGIGIGTGTGAETMMIGGTRSGIEMRGERKRISQKKEKEDPKKIKSWK